MIKLLRKRRSIRCYKSKPIDKKSVSGLIESALRSPSSRNNRPCEFVIVDDRGLLEIVVCGDSTKSDVWVEDCSIATILIQMMAESLKLGSCWIQIRNRKRADGSPSEEYIQSILGLPRHLKVEAIVSLGHPDEKREPVPKTALEFAKVKLNHYSKNYASEVITGSARKKA
jgi:nitroreductase